MKKIMIALASIAFAMASQAATVNWQGAYATDNAGTGLATGATVYLFASGYEATASALVAATWGVSDISDAVADGTFISGGWASKALDSTTIDAGGGFISTTKNYTGVDNGSSLSVFAVILDNTDAENPIAAYIAGADVTLDKISGLADWNAGAVYGSTMGGYVAQAVPEPTSGLLMLVGLAGLALRRRRA